MTKDTIPNPPATTAVEPSQIDVRHGAVANGNGYSGEEYDGNRHAIPRALKADAQADGPGVPAEDDDGAIPPDNGKRATIDEKTGAVHGSGAGAGGGNEGEDFSSDSATGDGFPITRAIPD